MFCIHFKRMWKKNHPDLFSYFYFILCQRMSAELSSMLSVITRWREWCFPFCLHSIVCFTYLFVHCWILQELSRAGLLSIAVAVPAIVFISWWLLTHNCLRETHPKKKSDGGLMCQKSCECFVDLLYWQRGRWGKKAERERERLFVRIPSVSRKYAWDMLRTKRYEVTELNRIPPNLSCVWT